MCVAADRPAEAITAFNSSMTHRSWNCVPYMVCIMTFIFSLFCGEIR